MFFNPVSSCTYITRCAIQGMLLHTGAGTTDYPALATFPNPCWLFSKDIEFKEGKYKRCVQSGPPCAIFTVLIVFLKVTLNTFNVSMSLMKRYHLHIPDDSPPPTPHLPSSHPTLSYNVSFFSSKPAHLVFFLSPIFLFHPFGIHFAFFTEPFLVPPAFFFSFSIIRFFVPLSVFLPVSPWNGKIFPVYSTCTVPTVLCYILILWCVLIWLSTIFFLDLALFETWGRLSYNRWLISRAAVIIYY
jgi:hypothetical protein